MSTVSSWMALNTSPRVTDPAVGHAAEGEGTNMHILQTADFWAGSWMAWEDSRFFLKLCFHEKFDHKVGLSEKRRPPKCNGKSLIIPTISNDHESSIIPIKRVISWGISSSFSAFSDIMVSSKQLKTPYLKSSTSTSLVSVRTRLWQR